MADENNIDINIGVNPAQAEKGSQRASAAVKKVTDSSKELDRAFRQIKSSIDPTFAAQEKYNKSLADAKRLLDAGRLSQEEYTAATRAAESALKAQVDAINRNSAAARAAAAEAKALKQQEAQAARDAAQAAVVAAREELAAKRQAAQQALADSRAAKAAERLAIRQAAQEAKAAASEALVAERAAKQEAAAVAREAAQAAIQSAREKKAAEIAASREAAEAEKQAKREARQAARDAASEAATAARTKREAERAAAAATREAATETKKLARAEAEAANAVRELRGSIDPAYAAQERYNQVMARATGLLMQNKLQQGEWIAIQKQAKAQMDVNVRSLGRMNSVYVQLGYQAQDVTASLASGINPLVILAQQGGQTAAALSMMGGTVGRVASFFAGPWGAAIIGATLLLGLFIGKNKEAAKSTLDVKDAEDLRKMKLDQLTESLKEFNKEQTKANTNVQEAHRLDLEAANRADARVDELRAQTQKKLSDAKASLDAILASGADEGGGALLYYSLRIRSLEKQLKTLGVAAKDATGAIVNSEIPIVMEKAEAATDAATAARQAYNREETRLQNIYTTQRLAADKITDVKKRQAAITQAQLVLEQGLVKAINVRKAAEEAASAAKRKGGGGIEESSQFIMPVGGPITSAFGKRESFKTANGNMASTNHAGIDIGAARGTAVKAPNVGVVEAVGYSPTLGKYVVINHGAGVTTRFGHMDTTNVQKGDSVAQGAKIGTVGSTGNATGPHLHYEVRVNGKAVDPSKGIFPIDKLEAEQKVAENAFEEIIAKYNEEIAAADDNYQLALQIQDKKIAAIQAYYGEDSKEATDAAKERIGIEKRLQDQLLNEHRKGIQARQAVDLAAEATRDGAAETRTGMKSDVEDFKVNIGAANEQEAAAAKKRIMEEEYQNTVVHEDRMYQIRLKAVQDQLALADLPVKQKIELNAQLEALEAEHNARMTGMQQQHARDVQQANLTSAAITANKWGEVASTMTSSFQSAFQGLWTHSITWQQALINIADQMVYKFVDMGAKMLQNWIMQQITKKAVTAATTAAETGIVVAGETAQTAAVVAGTTARVATTATGAAAEKGITIGSALLSIGASAAKAAAGAYAALAGIPIIGPVIAPAAAALALGAVIAFGAKIASARGGQGQVKQDGQITELHKDEMVLPAWIANPMRQSLQTRGSSRGMFNGAAAAGGSLRESTTNNNQGPSFYYQPKHNYTDMNAERMLEKDGAVFRKWLRNQARNGGLSFG